MGATVDTECLITDVDSLHMVDVSVIPISLPYMS